MRTLDVIKAASGVIVGQYVGAGSFPEGWGVYITGLETATGRRPLLVGADFGWGEWSAEWLQQLAEHYRAGGMVEVSCHLRNPFTGGPDTDLTRGRISDLFTAGTASNSRWRAMLAQQAERLLWLQGAGVEVMLRWLHEANGQWAWWQNLAPSDYSLLWQDSHQYMSIYGLTNLIWFFSPNRWYNGIARPELYYPGDEWCDLVGLDHYGNNLDEVPDGGYTALAGRGKPFLLGEFGPGSGGSEPAAGSFDYGALLTMMQAKCPLARGFMAWNGTYAIVRQRGASALLNDPRAVVLGTASAPIQPTATITATIKRELWWWKVTVTWQTTNATGAVLNGKSVVFNGSQTRTVSRGTYTYTLIATRGEYAASASVTVTAK